MALAVLKDYLSSSSPILAKQGVTHIVAHSIHLSTCIGIHYSSHKLEIPRFQIEGRSFTHDLLPPNSYSTAAAHYIPISSFVLTTNRTSSSPTVTVYFKPVDMVMIAMQPCHLLLVTSYFQLSKGDTRKGCLPLTNHHSCCNFHPSHSRFSSQPH